MTPFHAISITKLWWLGTYFLLDQLFRNKELVYLETKFLKNGKLLKTSGRAGETAYIRAADCTQSTCTSRLLPF